jgi:hypothetical protein
VPKRWSTASSMQKRSTAPAGGLLAMQSNSAWEEGGGGGGRGGRHLHNVRTCVSESICGRRMMRRMQNGEVRQEV